MREAVLARVQPGQLRFVWEYPSGAMSPGEEVTSMNPAKFFMHGHHHHAMFGGHGGRHGGPFGHGDGPGDESGGGFGVRRPLRFLAYKLDLDDAQVGELATILTELKIQRAQADVDQRRTTSALADVVAAEAFDEGKAQASAAERVKSAERVQGAVTVALQRIHALLKPEQRAKLAYLLRTGALSM